MNLSNFISFNLTPEQLQQKMELQKLYVKGGVVIAAGAVMTTLCLLCCYEIQKDFANNQRKPVSNLKKIKDVAILAGLCIGVNSAALLLGGPAAAITLVAFSILGIGLSFLPEKFEGNKPKEKFIKIQPECQKLIDSEQADPADFLNKVKKLDKDLGCVMMAGHVRMAGVVKADEQIKVAELLKLVYQKRHSQDSEFSAFTLAGEYRNLINFVLPTSSIHEMDAIQNKIDKDRIEKKLTEPQKRAFYSQLSSLSMPDNLYDYLKS